MASNINDEEELLLDCDKSSSNLQNITVSDDVRKSRSIPADDLDDVKIDIDNNDNDHNDDDDETMLLSSPTQSQSPKSKTVLDLEPEVFEENHRPTVTVPQPVDRPESAQIISDDDDDDVVILDGGVFMKPKFPQTQSQIVLDDDDTTESDEDDDEDDDEYTSLESEESSSDESSSLSYIESDAYLDGKIKIFYTHGSFFLWNAEDVQMLREECRIIGKLTGCLPRAPRQNNYLGLPLQLMPEEAKLLVDIEAAVVVEEDPVSEDLKIKREKAFKEVREENLKIQQKLYQEVRQQEVQHRFKDIIAGKKAKKRKLAQSSSKQDDNLIENSATASDPSKNEDPQRSGNPGGGDGTNTISDTDDETDKLTVQDIVQSEPSSKHALVQIFTESPWNQSLHIYEDWEYPNTEKELIRYLVFKDLWKKGFYMTSGSKFGGDFLVYPGDPARYHSHYIAICKNQYDETPSLEIVSYGRLASNVRKTALICSVDHNRKVLYTSIKWTGIT
ncbi:tRNA-splicing endonuclease subunit Sen34-like [Biomphalaria glabrata]|uniref:tRNA-splicing endonuclease subunit SEN34 n=1 Tax=Biomphalaria glabrata TaxID=6526 RepID=A0A9W2ZA68_BIOGL|nr:tRNA-splicing endonuclease subunit Sen34-like [Biomphalaria glabrata]XP_055871791.1 tRNA-splicing endonuclease subunit Sen34-like [Biomphalaria glabrata]